MASVYHHHRFDLRLSAIWCERKRHDCPTASASWTGTYWGRIGLGGFRGLQRRGRSSLELSATASDFGLPTLLAGPTNTSVTIWRSSSDFQLDQVFKLDKAEHDLTVTMTLTNISGAMIPDVRIARAYDPDLNNDLG